MESNSKRRKIDHAGAGLRHHGLIDFESRRSAQVSTATTLVLQTDQLLNEARLDYGRALGAVDGHLFRLKEIIESIDPHESIPIGDATARLQKTHNIVVPYPDPKPSHDAPYNMSYDRPLQCNVVGSYVARTMVKTQVALAIDMVVQMPKSLFQQKDYLNMRYFYRRAYYIAYIAAHLRKHLDSSMDLGFEYLNDNPLLPVLALRPPPNDSQTADTGEGVDLREKGRQKKMGYNIRLIPCAPDELFPRLKLTPTSDCNRNGDEDRGKGGGSVTPFYNSTLNAERTYIPYLRFLSHAGHQCSSLSDACILGRIWLQQRGFGGAISQGGFGHFEWAVLLSLLLHTGGPDGQAALSASLSSTELFKAAIQFLSTTELNSKSVAFAALAGGAKTIRESGPVLFDPIQELNVAYKMTLWSANLLRLYAKSTADLLADEAMDKFDAAFILNTNISPLVFDAVFEIDSPDVSSHFCHTVDRNSPMCKFSSEAYKILKKAYGERAQLVHFKQSSREPWPIHLQSPVQAPKVVVSVIFNPAHMSRQMEYGPPAEDQKEAAIFRQFWGDKAELRRFKDGSILECVEWTSKSPSQISEEIARYALKRHLKITKDEFTSFASGFSSILSFSHLDKEAFDAARRAFATLEHDLRSLENMPLQIRQMSPISPMARYSSVDPPVLAFHRGSIEPMDVNLYFEASGKWPENLTAIQEAKIDFLLDIDKRLMTIHENISTYLGREDRKVGVENLAFLDIVYDTGAAFRLRIHCDVEEALMQRDSMNKALDHRVRDDWAEALASFHWLYTTLPHHTQTVATFCTRLHSLSPSIRLARHWFDRHKLTNHFGPELIELFVLHVFLKPYPWTTPSSATAGFLRTLFFLSRWDWRDEPLIVDWAESLSSDDRSSIRKELESWRKRDPQMNGSVLFVATSNNQSGLAYTRDGPSKLVASRMTRLAKAACRLVREQPVRLDPSCLFHVSLRDYDVLIHLSRRAVRAVSDVADDSSEPGTKRPSRFKNLDGRTGRAPLTVRAHPLDVLVAELRRVYNDTLMFFRGGGDDDVVLAAIWSPRLQQGSPGTKFRAGLPYNFRRLAGSDADADLVELNRDAVLLEIARVGGDLVKKIEVVDEGAGEEG